MCCPVIVLQIHTLLMMRSFNEVVVKQAASPPRPFWLESQIEASAGHIISKPAQQFADQGGSESTKSGIAIELQHKLENLDNRELRAAARSAGVESDGLERAADSDDPRQTLIDMIVVLLIRAAAGPVESLQPRTNRDCVNDESVAVDKISDATSEGVQQNPDNYSPVGETERCTNDNGPFKSRDWYAPSPQDRKVSNNLCRCFVLLPIGITHMSILYVVAFGRGMQIAQHEIVDRLRSAVVPED
eukprot:SAG31_NODE_8120_length_1518_cov_1.739253_2_plen_245_part_00